MNEPTKKKIDKEGLSVMAQIGIYSASVVAGGLSVWASIREFFHHNIEKHEPDWFKEILDNEKAGFDNIKHLKGNEYIRKYREVHSAYSDAFTKIVKEKGFTGSIAKAKILNKSQLIKVGGIFVTVVAVTISAITSMRQDQRIVQKLEELKQDENNSPGMQR